MKKYKIYLLLLLLIGIILFIYENKNLIPIKNTKHDFNDEITQVMKMAEKTTSFVLKDEEKNEKIEVEEERKVKETSVVDKLENIKDEKEDTEVLPNETIDIFPNIKDEKTELEEKIVNIGQKIEIIKNKEQKDLLKIEIKKLKKRIIQLEQNDEYFKTLIKLNAKSLKELIKEYGNIRESISEIRIDIEKLNTEIELIKQDIKDLKKTSIVLNKKIDYLDDNLSSVTTNIDIFYRKVFNKEPFVVKTIIENQMAIISNGTNKIKLYKNNEVEINKVKLLVQGITKNCVELLVIQTNRSDKICK